MGDYIDTTFFLARLHFAIYTYIKACYINILTQPLSFCFLLCESVLALVSGSLRARVFSPPLL